MTKENTNHSSFLTFCKQIFSDWRHWFLLVLFFLLLFAGENIPLNNDADVPKQNINTPEISAGSSSYELSGILDSKSGETYHLLFQIKANDPNNIDQTQTSKEENISLGLTDKLGNIHSESSIVTTLNSTEYSDVDLLFTVDSNYSGLLFQKSDTKSQSAIYIKNVHLVRQSGAGKIQPSYLGFFDHGKSVENFSLLKATSSLGNLNGNSLIGQDFIATQQYLVGLDLKLHFRGNGGSGDYHLAIKEINNNKIAESNLAKIDFDSSTADKVYKKDEKSGVYHFPLTAKLTIGKEYVVLIDSTEVDSNILNNLQPIGSKIDGESLNEKLVTIGHNNEVKDGRGGLYLDLQYADQPSYLGESANFSGSFDDLGDGTGSFVFNSVNPFFILDDLTVDDNILVYKVNTLYPIQAAYLDLTLDTDKSSSDSKIEYSFDNKSWTQVDSGPKSALTGRYTKQISGDNSAKIIYVRISGDNMADNTSALKSLLINARVKTNE